MQIVVESAFSESKSVREDFCRSRVEKYSISAELSAHCNNLQPYIVVTVIAKGAPVCLNCVVYV